MGMRKSGEAPSETSAKECRPSCLGGRWVRRIRIRRGTCLPRAPPPCVGTPSRRRSTRPRTAWGPRRTRRRGGWVDRSRSPTGSPGPPVRASTFIMIPRAGVDQPGCVRYHELKGPAVERPQPADGRSRVPRPERRQVDRRPPARAEPPCGVGRHATEHAVALAGRDLSGPPHLRAAVPLRTSGVGRRTTASRRATTRSQSRAGAGRALTGEQFT
jgi:hypothetical protein